MRNDTGKKSTLHSSIWITQLGSILVTPTGCREVNDLSVGNAADLCLIVSWLYT